MQGRMWIDAKIRFEGQYVRLFVKNLTKVLSTPAGEYAGMFAFTGRITFREDYLILAPGSEYESWLQADVIDAIALDKEDEDEDDEPAPDREIHPGIGETDWDNAFKWLRMDDERQKLNGDSEFRDIS